MKRRRASSSWPRLCVVLGIVCASACKSEGSAKPAPAPAKPASGAAGAPSVAAASPPAAAPAKPAAPAAKPLEWDDPPEWKRVKPNSPMRRASYEIPPAKGDPKPAELNVFVLGGDVDANIQRWIDEFSGFDPKSVVRNDRSVNEMRQAVVEVPKGKFNGGMNEVKVSDNYGLLGAIVVTPSGAEYFFKLTGPSATVKAAKGPFYRMLDSIRQEGGHAQPGSIEAAKGAAAPKPARPAPKSVANAPAKK